MRNKLDAKAIVDKAALLELLDLLCLEGNTDDMQRVRYMLRRMKRDLEQQDFTDWVAAPAQATNRQLLPGAHIIEGLKLTVDRYGETCIEGGTMVAVDNIYKAMLEASPPLSMQEV